jgi:hypothetical protein
MADRAHAECRMALLRRELGCRGAGIAALLLEGCQVATPRLRLGAALTKPKIRTIIADAGHESRGWPAN